MKLLRLITLTALLFSPSSVAAGNDRSVTEFNSRKNDTMDWAIVDDGVMGGLSKGKATFTDSGTLRFAGKLSLENNGGFSSVRTKTVVIDLADSKGLIMRVKGDGRIYQLRLNTDARYGSGEVSFKADFPTIKGKWHEVKVPFSKFVASWRGRTLDNKFDPAKIRRLGLLLGDKKPGTFELEVDWIRAFGST
ncbi:MAG: NADH dehydrogenase [ubiquinone] 1 alpha subcomplex assembly factor 1 [Verrucomicrobiales bacterium]|jgi:NADH dehydrogenase [ubiquinone] 1 alpha subcomplex assembly factor 1